MVMHCLPPTGGEARRLASHNDALERVNELTATLEDIAQLCAEAVDPEADMPTAILAESICAKIEAVD